MPDIKLRDGSGVEQVYTGVDTITVPLADGSGTWTFGLTDEELNFSDRQSHESSFSKGRIIIILFPFVSFVIFSVSILFGNITF